MPIKKESTLQLKDKDKANLSLNTFNYTFKSFSCKPYFLQHYLIIFIFKNVQKRIKMIKLKQ